MSINKKKLIIVDDSRLFREALAQKLSESHSIEVIGTASDAFEAKDMVAELKPDVMVIDVEMPKMNGFEFVKELMSQYPVPCIMVTSNVNFSEADAKKAGAADFMLKPSRNNEFGTFASIIATKAIIAAGNPANYKKRTVPTGADGLSVPLDHTANALKKAVPELPDKADIAMLDKRAAEGYVVALGASTGGTDALECVIKAFPDNMPPVVVVQHMPPVFTRMYAERLDKSCAVRVREAFDGARVTQGDCIIGAGGVQLELKKDAKGYYVKCYEGEKVSGHCPSVDVLFRSVAETVGAKTAAALLTGMGADGAQGLLKIHQKGAYTIGQDKESCVVYGMPMEAYKLGACTEQLPLSKIGAALVHKLATGWK